MAVEMTVVEAARKWDVSESSVRQYCADGIVSHKRFGKTIVILQEKKPETAPRGRPRKKEEEGGPAKASPRKRRA